MSEPERAGASMSGDSHGTGKPRDECNAASVSYEKVIDLRGVLQRARDALYDAADPGGAPRAYRLVGDEVAELIVALDQETERLSRA